MAAYVIVNIDVHDQETYAEYRAVASATVEQYGGKYLVRGGASEILEGAWQPKRVVILEFPTVEQAKRWHESEEYRGPKSLRQRAAQTEMVVVEGLS